MCRAPTPAPASSLLRTYSLVSCGSLSYHGFCMCHTDPVDPVYQHHRCLPSPAHLTSSPWPGSYTTTAQQFTRELARQMICKQFTGVAAEGVAALPKRRLTWIANPTIRRPSSASYNVLSFSEKGWVLCLLYGTVLYCLLYFFPS